MNWIKNLFPLSEKPEPKSWQVHVFAGVGLLLSFLRGARHGSLISLGVATAFGLFWLFRRDLLAKFLAFLIQACLILIQTMALLLLTLSFFTVILAMHFWLNLKKKDPLQRSWHSDASYLEAPENFNHDSFLRPF